MGQPPARCGRWPRWRCRPSRRIAVFPAQYFDLQIGLHDRARCEVEQVLARPRGAWGPACLCALAPRHLRCHVRECVRGYGSVYPWRSRRLDRGEHLCSRPSRGVRFSGRAVCRQSQREDRRCRKARCRRAGDARRERPRSGVCGRLCSGTGQRLRERVGPGRGLLVGGRLQPCFRLGQRDCWYVRLSNSVSIVLILVSGVSASASASVSSAIDISIAAGFTAALDAKINACSLSADAKATLRASAIASLNGCGKTDFGAQASFGAGVLAAVDVAIKANVSVLGSVSATVDGIAEFSTSLKAKLSAAAQLNATAQAALEINAFAAIFGAGTASAQTSACAGVLVDVQASISAGVTTLVKSSATAAASESTESRHRNWLLIILQMLPCRSLLLRPSTSPSPLASHPCSTPRSTRARFQSTPRLLSGRPPSRPSMGAARRTSAHRPPSVRVSSLRSTSPSRPTLPSSARFPPPSTASRNLRRRSRPRFPPRRT
jgi:hypothetical protein